MMFLVFKNYTGLRFKASGVLGSSFQGPGSSSRHSLLLSAQVLLGFIDLGVGEKPRRFEPLDDLAYIGVFATDSVRRSGSEASALSKAL